MDGPVLTDIHALHETHVGVEQKSLGRFIGIGRGAGSLHVGNADEAIEVGDSSFSIPGAESDFRAALFCRARVDGTRIAILSD